jgi:diamine N-acetyltransferase
MITLREITRDNLDDVLALRVADDQTAYVSTTAHALAQAYVSPKTAFPFAVCEGETVVGFLMLGYYEARNQYTVWKFLIDRRYQGRGYGKAALKLGVDFLRERFGVKEIFLGVSAGNETAKRLYRSVGFKETGAVDGTMEEMRLEC